MTNEQNAKRIDELNNIRREVYKINNKIARINFTKKHYLSWMECSNTEPRQTFIEYLDGLKSCYVDEIKKLREEAENV